MEKMSKLAMLFAIAGLICNIIMISYEGVPISIPLGIFGIAFAIQSKEEGSKKITGKGKTALILSIVALIFGLLLYAMTIITTSAMADPKMSKIIIDTLKSMKDQFPEELQEMFAKSGIPLE